MTDRFVRFVVALVFCCLGLRLSIGLLIQASVTVRAAITRALPHIVADVLGVLIVGLFAIGLVDRLVRMIGVAWNDVQNKARGERGTRTTRARGAEHLVDGARRGRSHRDRVRDQ